MALWSACSSVRPVIRRMSIIVVPSKGPTMLLAAKLPVALYVKQIKAAYPSNLRFITRVLRFDPCKCQPQLSG